jgi:hypothetical protein
VNSIIVAWIADELEDVVAHTQFIQEEMGRVTIPEPLVLLPVRWWLRMRHVILEPPINIRCIIHVMSVSLKNVILNSRYVNTAVVTIVAVTAIVMKVNSLTPAYNQAL